MAQTKDLTVGNPLSLILKFALPLLGGILFQQAYNIADAAIVGRYLGASALAAVGASSSVQFLTLGFCTGTMIGFSVPVAQRFGAHDYSGMRRFVFCAWLLIAATAVSVTSLCAIFCEKILSLLQTPADIFDDSWKYLFIIFLGIPFIILYNWLSSLLRAVGDSKTPFAFLVFSTILNIGLDLLFIVVFAWGVLGAAVATILSQGTSGLLCLLYIHFNFDVLRLNKEDRRFDGRFALTLIKIGVPMGLQFSITAVGSMIMQGANNALGTVYVSAFSAATKIKQFAISPFDALATSVSTFASQNYGAHKFDRIKKGFSQGILVGLCLGAFLAFVLVFFGRQLSMIFISGENEEILDASQKFLFIGGFFYPVISLLNVSRLTVQGLGYSNRAIFSGVIEMFARIIVSLAIVPVLGWTAICFCDQAAWVCATFFIFSYCIHLIGRLQKEGESRQKFPAKN